MAPYAVSVTYRIPWRGLTEYTSCIFHYDPPSPIALESGWKELCDNVNTQFKTLLSSQQAITHNKVWGPTNAQDPADNIMRFTQDVTVAGTNTGGGEYNSELAVMAWVYLGRGPKGGKRILRKYIHGYALHASGAGNTALFGRGQLAAGDKTPFVTALNNLKTVSVGGSQVDICAPNGDHLPLGSSWAVHNYLVTRQFRRRGKRRPTNPATV